ncbi:MAG: hypothetical protein ACOC22_01830 [bacterium]
MKKTNVENGKLPKGSLSELFEIEEKELIEIKDNILDVISSSELRLDLTIKKLLGRIKDKETFIYGIVLGRMIERNENS